ncbi:hypothetical protein KEJ47_10145, partial [Candidatus Bathyarchaeota archaeon]|nr:hypothetical protein [Candidatus Bathyarchaeota archaeon]
EKAADPTGTVNDLDKYVEITGAWFGTGTGSGEWWEDILDSLESNYDNGDHHLKLSELDCKQWDVLTFVTQTSELTPSTKYYLKFIFKFEEDADNEYQGDRIVVKMIITALQEVWKGNTGGVQSKPFERSMLLVEKDPNTWKIKWDGAWGQLIYNDSYSPPKMLLILNGLKGSNWYMVTFQAGKWWTGSDIPDNAMGIFGRKTNSDPMEWIDVALVKTDASGKANVMIPTLSGLTKEDCGNPGNWHGYPTLTPGTYTVSVIVKDVGVSGTHPAWGGLPSLPNPITVLYETELITFKVS